MKSMPHDQKSTRVGQALAISMDNLQKEGKSRLYFGRGGGGVILGRYDKGEN